MNQAPVFTEAQLFGKPAAPPVSPHAAKESGIDPHNPFDNDTEFRHYNADYGYIVPQIRIPGCKIPVKPNRQEKSKIRKYYNIAGFGALGHIVLSNMLSLGFMLVFFMIASVVDAARLAGEMPENYDTLLEDYFLNSSSAIAMNLTVYMLCNVIVTLIGLKISKTPVSSLFQTRDLHASTMIGYMFIAIGLQQICGYLAYFITVLMEGMGITAFEADFSTTTDIKSVVLMAIYTCIVAPVTEELLFRGFFLKNLSRVSQRFGIVMSAVLFGLWHENIAQFVLAFFVGIFMGYITVKHNSIVPAIICHMTVNTASELFSLAETYGLDMLYNVMNWIYMGFALFGTLLLIVMLLRERLPYTTPHQAERGTRLALTSIPLVVSIIIHVVMTIVLILQESGIV
ncbi:MAG: CPBP family intramembrane metalloprotease [Oscillospiraceae bacterium]|nr:CPBP family intramembrane metalloprotease [Oscillospiraceae bacterium]